MLNKTEFARRYNSLSVYDKRNVKQYYEDLYKGAVFETTFDEAERCLLWIREIEEGY